MGILDFLKKPAPQETQAESPYLRKVLDSLNSLPEDQAKYIATFAYILGRVAQADLEISEEETRSMEKTVRDLAGLDPDLAALIVQIAKSQNVLFGGTENYLMVREFKKMADKNQLESLMHCLFAVAGADNEISHVENEEIRVISKELGISHQDFIEIRLHYRDKLSILKNLPK